MRFVGLVLVLVGGAVVYFLAYRGMSVDEMRTRLAQLLNLPGLAPPAASTSVWATAQTLDPFNGGNAIAGVGKSIQSGIAELGALAPGVAASAANHG